MKKNLLYEKIKQLLNDYPDYRNSDRKLIWRIWMEQGFVYSMRGEDLITYPMFMKATSPETIRRTRQKIQQNFPELRSSEKVLQEKSKIEAQKGTHVYREPFTGMLFN
jgi:hypothetical protein